MSISAMILENISDLLLLLSFFISAELIFPLNGKADTGFVKRLIVSVLISVSITMMYVLNYYSTGMLVFNWILLLLDSFKYVILTMFLFKTVNSKLVSLLLILQFFCSTLTTSVMLFIPQSAADGSRILNVAVLLSVRLILLAITVLMRNKADRYTFRNLFKIIPVHVYVLIFTILFIFNGVLQVLTYNTSDSELKIRVVKVFMFLLVICITATVLSLIFSVVSKSYESNVNEILKKQVESQVRHYRHLEKVNNEIHSFRHDYLNHMICIKSMLAGNEYGKLNDYIGRLSEEAPSVKDIFTTGNSIADAILTEKQNSSPEDIKIEFNGVIPDFIDSTDLCIVLSNALDNAVEACCQCSGNKLITVHCGHRHGYFILKIKNPTVNDIHQNGLATTKADAENHGFGLLNIRKTVTKYDGHISTDYENGMFTLNIAFAQADNKTEAPLSENRLNFKAGQ